jgi:hypothetical protein
MEARTGPAQLPQPSGIAARPAEPGSVVRAKFSEIEMKTGALK